MYIDGSVRSYLDDLAAKKSAPGGGSAAALMAATGAALISMVANFTIGKAGSKETEGKMADALVKAEKARLDLEDLIDQDVKVYRAVLATVKTHGLMSSKSTGVFIDAMRPPLGVCKCVGELMPLAVLMVDEGNQNLITDAAGASVALEAAFILAKMNVLINLSHVKNDEYGKSVKILLATLEAQLQAMRQAVVARCEAVLGASE